MPNIVLPATEANGPNWLFPLLGLIKNGVILTDYTSKILYVNNAYLAATGYTADEVIGQNPGMMRSGYHDEDFYRAMWGALKTAGIWEGEVWNRSKSGKIFPIALTITKIQFGANQDPYYLGIFNEILTARTADAAEINLAVTDFLTKLPNKMAAEDYYARTIKNLQRDYADVKDKLAVIYIDMDDFKSINAKYGYVMGDLVLQQFASKLDLLVRSVDFLARLESDHFVIIMSNPLDHDELEEFFLQVNTEFSRPFMLEGEKIYTNCSFGIATLENANESLDDLVKRAAANEQ